MQDFNYAPPVKEVDIVDNLTTDDATKVLSAKQGKNLKDQIPAVVNNLTSDSTTSALSAAQGKALNSNLHNYISYADYTFNSVVVSADNDYKKLGNFYSDIGLPSGAYIVSYYVRGWSGATGVFTLLSSSNGQDLYIYAAKAGTITSITVRVWYSML